MNFTLKPFKPFDPATLPRRPTVQLDLGDIVPQHLHRKVGWDLRHHFMAEKIMAKFNLKLPRDRELVRQLAVVYVLGGHKEPPPALSE
jgi:hypothetical protein